MKFLNRNKQGSIEYEISITSHTGKTFDITQQVDLIEIYEDITNFGLSGSFNFIDLLGIKEFLPLIGGEKITLIYRTDDQFDYVHNNFYVTKIGKEQQVGNYLPRKSIKVFFVSELIINNFKTAFSKSYNHKQISFIINDIYENMLLGKKVLTIDATKNTISFIIPNWNPNKTIEYLMKRSLSSSYNDGGYLFFETAKDVNFISLPKIYNSESIFDFYFHNPVKNEAERNTGYLGNPNYYENIHTIDLLEETKKGVYGSSLYAFDYALKQFIRYSVDYQKSENNTSLGKIIPIYDKYDSRNSSISEFTEYINDRLGDGVEFQKAIDDGVKLELRNRILYGGLNRNAHVVGVFGNSDFTCGKMINVNFNSQDQDNILNEKLTGKFLMKSIKNKISLNDGYSQVLLITKSFYSQDSQGVLKRI